MTKINRLIIQGFKSFPSKICISFPSGFNVICGPNGCGKSNVIDAISFVLGTSSAKAIRANKLKNLLFNGAENKKPAEYCKVSMYLDNAKREIPMDKEEIKISRKVSRSGVSIYKVNGKTVTKSKMVDLLSHANISPDGYNIIMQGDVTKVIEMSSQQRRGIIDELSGIAEFDDKKKKAERELEKVSTRVREMMIVITEKEKEVKRLKEEKRVAEKHQKLEKKLKRAKSSLAHTKLENANKELKELQEKLEKKKKKFKDLDKGFKTRDKESGQKEKKIKSLTRKIIEKSKNYEIKEEIEGIKTALIKKNNELENNRNEIKRLRAMISRATSRAVKEVLSMDERRVYGTVSNLVSVPSEYITAIDVSLGSHINDIIVSTGKIAAKCIKYLKRNKIGRARFLPLNKMKPRTCKKPDNEKVCGVAKDLVTYDNKYSKAIEFLLGNSLVVEDIDTARKINSRAVTLTGDLKERSGAMTGGFYKKKKKGKKYEQKIHKLKNSNDEIENQIEELESKLEKTKEREKEESEEVKELENRRKNLEKNLEDLKPEMREKYEHKNAVQSEINQLNVKKAKLEARIENLEEKFEELEKVGDYIHDHVDGLKEIVRQTLIEINKLGPVNMKSIEEYETINVEFGEMRNKLDTLLKEKDAVEVTINDIEKKRYSKFMETMERVSEIFSKIYYDMMQGKAKLALEEEDNIDSGLVIEASPTGKSILNLDSMSGGEKTMTSLAFLFAVMQHHSSPFYILDEVDAALDKTNTKKIDVLIGKYSKDVQFIVVTHNDNTIASADNVIGVSMEKGVSKVLGIDMGKNVKNSR